MDKEPTIPQPILEPHERDFDWSVVFADEDEGGLMQFVPIINSVLLLIILIILFFKK